MNPFRRAYEGLEARRAASMARKLRGFLEPGETVLDLGCGNLIVAEALEKLLGVRVIGIDTLAYPRRPLPMARYSGTRAPFRDGSFDAVFIGFVLHHCDDGGLAALREARRLARKRILILEDGFDGPFERLLIKVVDRCLNWIENPEVKVPYRFRPTREWLDLFQELGLHTLAAKRVRTTPILRTRQVLFVLEK